MSDLLPKDLERFLVGSVWGLRNQSLTISRWIVFARFVFARVDKRCKPREGEANMREKQTSSHGRYFFSLIAFSCILIPGTYHPRTLAKISGATIVASDSMTNLGVSTLSFPQVIFSLGTAPE